MSSDKDSPRIGRKATHRIHGSVYVNNGYWYVSVRLPGELKRHKRPLCAPGSERAMRADRPRAMAIEAAHRIWEDAVRTARTAPASTLSVNELCDRFLRHAAVYYRGGSETHGCACALRVLREIHGHRPVAELVHTDLLAVRDGLVRRDLARVTVNGYMRILTHRLVPWALDEGLIRAATAAELSQVRPLKRGRTTARECAPVRPVADGALLAAVAALVPNTADMVRVHRLTGMRPAELCSMRWQDVDESVTPWVYRPAHHKNEWRGRPRVVLIGPRARAILERWRGEDYPFSPVRATVERMAELRARRTSPFYPCRDESYSRAKEGAQRRPRGHWDTATYGRTVRAACVRAGIEPFGVNRIRHAFGTEVRRKFGLEATRAALGHSDGGCVTDRYSFDAIEDEIIRTASAAVEAIG